jgi:hypothetical protein
MRTVKVSMRTVGIVYLSFDRASVPICTACETGSYRSHTQRLVSFDLLIVALPYCMRQVTVRFG